MLAVLFICLIVFGAISLPIGINNTEHLNRVVARLSKVKDVLKVTRS